MLCVEVAERGIGYAGVDEKIAIDSDGNWVGEPVVGGRKTGCGQVGIYYRDQQQIAGDRWIH